MHAGLTLELLALAAAGAAWSAALDGGWSLAGRGRGRGRPRTSAMTEQGFSGNPRYVVPALALACVLAGVGAAGPAPGATGPLAVRRLVAAAGARRAPSSAAAWPKSRDRGAQVGARMEMHADLAAAVDRRRRPRRR